ncbi:MAG: hypothetical protein P9M13_10215 [Candidatus Ancaeobacter aquaticus]|nr:hypothetical protein [Candidatus Ancaeobacter aquaticus]
MKYKIFIGLIAFYVCAIFSVYAATDMVTVKSYNKNFVVQAPDQELASVVASELETVREKFFNSFGWKQNWHVPLEIHISNSINEKKTKLKLSEGTLVRSVDIPLTGNYFWEGIVPEVIRHILITESGIGQASTQSVNQKHVPQWLVRGIVFYLDPKTADVYENVTRGGFMKGKPMQLEQLYGTGSGRYTSEQTELLGCQTAFLVDYLLHLQRGKERFKLFVASLNENEGWKCVFEDMYYGDFKYDEALRKRLTNTLRKPERISLNFPRMGFQDTLELLNDALAVKVSIGGVVKEENLYMTGLRSCKPCCTKEIARRKLMQAYPMLLKLKFEGDKSLMSVIDKYITAYASSTSDKELFWERLIEAENERKRLNSGLR